MLLVSQPVSIKDGLRTTDYRLGVKYGLGIKRGLENTDWVYIKHEQGIMYRSNPSFNIPPPAIPQAYDTFAVPGRREFDYQSLPRGGDFDPHALGVENLNCTLYFM